MTNIEILESVNIKHKELKEDRPLLLLNILKAMDLARTEQSILSEVSRELKADFAKGEEVTFTYKLLGEIEEIENDRFTINRDGKRYILNRKNVNKL